MCILIQMIIDNKLGFMSRYSSWDNSKVYQFEKQAAKYLGTLKSHFYQRCNNQPVYPFSCLFLTPSLGVEYTLMVNSGTSALTCCLIGIKYQFFAF